MAILTLHTRKARRVDKKESRKMWNKISLPPDFADMVDMMCKIAGYHHEDMHFFIYHLLKKAYPEQTESLTKYLELGWMDQPPSPPKEQGE